MGSDITPADDVSLPRRGIQPAVWLGHGSAVVGLIAAIIYATGALVKVAQLHGAGVSVSDFLPLLPLPSLLAQGVAVFTQQAFLYLFIALSFLYMFPTLGLALVAIASDKPPSPSVKKFTDRAVYGAIAIAAAVNLFTADPVTLLVFIALPLYILTQKHLVTGEWRLRIYLLFIFTTIGLLGLLRAYVYPNPLPRATLTLSNGGQATGGYLIKTESVWYLVQPSKSLRAVPDSQVTNATIVHVKRRKPRTPYQIVRGWLR